jgi:predicted ATPase
MALVCSSGGVLLIDEWEAGLHPSALYRVTEWLVRAARVADVQIVGTTHSLEAFDAVVGATQADGVAMCAYWMERTAEGHRVKRYDGDRLLSLREHGMDLR